MKQAVRLLWVTIFAWSISGACAEPISENSPSANLYGTIGLNTIPTARMDQAGTLRASIGAADPYVHTSLGYQVTDRFFFGLRQTSEISNLRDDPDSVYPGLDLKLKLFDERLFRPEISIGLQSAFGHRRMAGEYLAFSKRYENFDFTGGFGWGRLGTRHDVPNPLDWTDSYLGGNRKLDGNKPNSPSDWFTGDTGFFAGIEYATPLKGLSLKADWSSDSYKAERALGQDGPSAYSFGLSYQPADWVDMGVAVLDKDTVMARLSLKTSLKDWPFYPSRQENYIGLVPDRQNQNIVAEGKKYGLQIRNILPDTNGMSGQLFINDTQTTPYQLSQAWRIVTNKTPKENPEVLRLEPVYFGLKAPGISITKRDLVDAENHQGSAEEMWRHIAFDENLTGKKSKLDKYIPVFKFRENFSLSEDDAPFIHRSDLLATLSHQFMTNFLSETTLRYNLASNYKRLNEMRLAVNDPIRSDTAYYLEKKFAVERFFVQGFKSLSTNWHTSAQAGYLDEMFAGYHGEVLYRPWGRNWAVGIDGAYVIKRDYETPLNLGYLGDSKVTGLANFYYEIPDTNMTLQASMGQYLAKDKGGTLAFKNRFRNGATVEVFITATNMHDPNPYGGASNYSSGLRFTLPLGSLKYLTEGSGIEVNAVPASRDVGQQVDIAHRLYDMTEPLSYRHLAQNWADVTN